MKVLAGSIEQIADAFLHAGYLSANQPAWPFPTTSPEPDLPLPAQNEVPMNGVVQSAENLGSAPGLTESLTTSSGMVEASMGLGSTHGWIALGFLLCGALLVVYGVMVGATQGRARDRLTELP